MKKNSRISSKGLTILLAVVLFLLIALNWSLFISGPSRIHEEKEAQTITKIEKRVEGIQGLRCHVFDYVTYNGYLNDTLYWFDENGDTITKREIINLDYDKAKEIAKEEYGINCDSIELAYGYNNPCYEIRGDNRLILIDFDTFVRVYEREI
ncbi:hypothetical protein [Floccifex sp.]|uniref:hypothetical protein n=1 Tax=Floccifex sp. TaxID=2815810 RepID=UPI003F003D2B